MMMKQIVIICVFLIILMPMSLAMLDKTKCSPAFCSAEHPERDSIANGLFDGTKVELGPEDEINEGVPTRNGVALMDKAHPQAPYSEGDFKDKDRSKFRGEKNLLEVPSDVRPTTAGTRGSANQMFKEALGEIQGIMQLIGSLDLKTLLAEKEKPDPGPDPSPTPSPGFNYVAVTKNGDETTTRLVGDALVYQEEREGSRSAASEVNDPKNPGETTTKGSTLENAIVSNTKTTFFDEGKKVLTAETPENPKTSIIFDPSSDIPSFAFTLQLINKLITHLSRTFVSAQPNQGQYIHLIGRDMDINGIKLKVRKSNFIEDGLVRIF